MTKKTKVNYWKVMTFLFIMVIVFEVAIISITSDKEYYNFGDIKIEKKVLGNLASNIQTDKFKLCNILENKCVILQKLNNGK